MSLKFIGDWSPWAVVTLALLLGGAAWVLYRRESRVRGKTLAWVLPALRIAAIAVALLLLTGPVVHSRTVQGERGRVLIFVDASRSMGLTDEAMETPRKLLAVHRLGWLPQDALDPQLSEAADALARARAAAGGDAVDPAARREAGRAFVREIEAAAAALAKVRADTGGAALERRGAVLREVWNGVPGAAVADLTRHRAYPAKPDATAMHELFEAPSNWADAYGTRMRGFVQPPVTGNYVFWIAGDDQAELWVSPDGDPARKQLVAKVDPFSEPRGWDQNPTQKSAPIRLTAGQKGYVEALHKEGGGGDSLAVGWQLPDGKMERPIPGNRLSAPTQSADTPAKAAEAMAAKFREEVLAPAQSLLARGADPAKSMARLPEVLSAVSRWEKSLRDAFANYANRTASQPSAAMSEALKRFDGLPRWKRAEALLFGGAKSLVAALSEKHHVDVLALEEREARPIWSSGRSADETASAPPKELPGAPGGRSTNLADGLRSRVGDRDEERTAALLLSDGRHNEGSSPLQAAKVLGARKIPVYAVGFGGTGQPEDLAVLEVRSPASVYFKDRVKGEVILKDDMPAGRAFTLKIEANGELLWERKLATEQAQVRRIPFDFPVQGLVEKQAGAKRPGVEVLSLPLSFTATVSPVDGEREKRNNDAAFSLHGVMSKRRALVLDGRPRWELRYLRNLFERDEQWEVNALLADRGNGPDAWPRGAGAGKFPADRESLFAYDLVVFGEVPRQFFRLEELEWLRDFVDKRGGGLMVIDGRRGHVAGYADTPLGALFPVDWKADPVGRPSALRPTDTGSRKAMLQLAGDADKNFETWASLLPPHWVANARVLPGAEVLLEAVAGERRVPALVQRRFGAGKVLYSGFDESWRWRHEVADLHHQRYWNQAVREVMEPPFTVRDARSSLGVGKLVYNPGEAVEIRARVRDAQGRPVEKGDVEALVYAGDRKVATVKLSPDDPAGGLFQGQVAALPGGRYQVRLRGGGLPEDGRTTTEFVVRAAEAAELAVLTCNEDLLRQIAAQSNGAYYREEELRGLEARLEPLNKERVFESDLVLGQSWWIFVPLVLLLTAEWVLRKWAGML